MTANLIATGTDEEGNGNRVNIAAADGVAGGNVKITAGKGQTDGGGGSTRAC